MKTFWTMLMLAVLLVAASCAPRPGITEAELSQTAEGFRFDWKNEKDLNGVGAKVTIAYGPDGEVTSKTYDLSMEGSGTPKEFFALQIEQLQQNRDFISMAREILGRVARGAVMGPAAQQGVPTLPSDTSVVQSQDQRPAGGP